MAQIIYQISSGTPNFTAHLQPSVVVDQVHSALGIYSFDGIPNGMYILTIIDANGCRSTITVNRYLDSCTLEGIIDCNLDCTMIGEIDCNYIPEEPTTSTTSSTSSSTTTTTIVPITTTTTTTICSFAHNRIALYSVSAAGITYNILNMTVTEACSTIYAICSSGSYISTMSCGLPYSSEITINNGIYNSNCSYFQNGTYILLSYNGTGAICESGNRTIFHVEEGVITDLLICNPHSVTTTTTVAPTTTTTTTI